MTGGKNGTAYAIWGLDAQKTGANCHPVDIIVAVPSGASDPIIKLKNDFTSIELILYFPNSESYLLKQKESVREQTFAVYLRKTMIGWPFRDHYRQASSVGVI